MEITITLAQYVKSLVDMSDWHSINDGHSDRVSDLSIKIGEKLKLSDEQLFYLKWGAELHDIGRVGIENDILAKRGKVTEGQYGSIKTHPEIGYKIIKDTLPKEIGEIILYHHENYSGTGYPKGLFGESIPLLARIVKVADVWDALTSDRPYRKALTQPNAIHLMNLQVDDFDPKIYIIFLELIRTSK